MNNRNLNKTLNQELIGIVAGILTSASLVPQLIKSLKEKRVDVNFWMFILLLGGNGLWILYGIRLEAMPIIFTNAFAFCMDLTMLALRWLFGKKS